ncbi:hypothetical protein D3C71_1348030 [compost metagenome]
MIAVNGKVQRQALQLRTQLLARLVPALAQNKGQRGNLRTSHPLRPYLILRLAQHIFECGRYPLEPGAQAGYSSGETDGALVLLILCAQTACEFRGLDQAAGTALKQLYDPVKSLAVLYTLWSAGRLDLLGQLADISIQFSEKSFKFGRGGASGKEGIQFPG